MSEKRPMQTDSQSLGNVGETTVQLILQKYKWTADIIKSDFGEDIDCNVFIDNFRTNYHLRCQVKSTTQDSEYVKKISNGDYSVSIDSCLLSAWLTSYFPVFLMIYEEESDLCHWCNPVEQILKNPSKLEKDKPTIRVPKENIFDFNSKNVILEEVKKFYRKIQRLDESTIQCKVLPVLMPGYRIIPLHNLLGFHNNSYQLSSEIAADYLELLPSWMSVLKRIDPSSILSTIQLNSSHAELDSYLANLKQKLNSFKYPLKSNEWVTFIISPTIIQSNNSSWSNEITSWRSYIKLENKEIIDDYEYNFEKPDGFLRQITRCGRSWPYLHSVNPDKDIALHFFGCYEITPSIKKIKEIHNQNIKGQLVLWKCKKNEIQQLINLIEPHELSIQVIEDQGPENLIAITTFMFDPFLGLYSLPMDWDSFENGNIKNRLIQNKLISLLPGKEYDGEIPAYLEEALNRYSERNYKNVLISDSEYIEGMPLLLEDRQICVSRFQMLMNDQANEIESQINKLNSFQLKKYNLLFAMIDNSFGKTPIYELSARWIPELLKSSKQSFNDQQQDIINLFNSIMPTVDNSLFHMKNTCEILHLAGEIGFEPKEN